MNRCHESMTRIQLGEWTVRVWVTEETMVLGPRMEIYDALIAEFEALLPHRFKYHHIAKVLETFPCVSAYEILDEHKNGAIIYPDWH